MSNYRVGLQPRGTCLKQKSIRTTLNIPVPLYRKLKESSAASGRSVHDLLLADVETVLMEGQRPRPRKVRFPLIVSKGPKVNVTNEQIYEHVEFS